MRTARCKHREKNTGKQSGKNKAIGNATLKFLGNSDSARREIDRLLAKIERVEDRQKNMNARGTAGSARQIRTIGQLVARLGAVQLAYQAVAGAARAVMQANKDISAGIDRTAKELSSKKLGLQIQADISDAEVKRRLPRLIEQLKATPSADVSQALEMDTQSASSGFAEEDIASGDALAAMLRLRAASNQFGRDTGNVADGIRDASAFLKANGIDVPDVKSIEGLASKFVELFAGTELQFGDFADLAKVAPQLSTAGFNQDQQLAMFSVLNDVMPSSEAGTGLRQLLKLQTVADSKDKTEAFEALRDEQGQQVFDLSSVDLLEGDNPIEVLERLRDGLARVTDQLDEETGKVVSADQLKSSFLTKVFGDEGRSAAQILISKSDISEERTERVADAGESMRRRVLRFQESDEAVRARREIETTEVELELDDIRGGITFDDVSDEFNLQIKKAMASVERSGDEAGALAVMALNAAGSEIIEQAKGTGVSPLALANNLDEIALVPGTDADDNAMREFKDKIVGQVQQRADREMLTDFARFGDPESRPDDLPQENRLRQAGRREILDEATPIVDTESPIRGLARDIVNRMFPHAGTGMLPPPKKTEIADNPFSDQLNDALRQFESVRNLEDGSPQINDVIAEISQLLTTPAAENPDFREPLESLRSQLMNRTDRPQSDLERFERSLPEVSPLLEPAAPLGDDEKPTVFRPNVRPRPQPEPATTSDDPTAGSLLERSRRRDDGTDLLKQTVDSIGELRGAVEKGNTILESISGDTKKTADGAGTAARDRRRAGAQQQGTRS